MMTKKTNIINIISYNILADYLNNENYIFGDKKYLTNKYRIPLLTKKLDKILSKNKNTILCLQEVGPLHLSSLLIMFSKYNYQHINFKELAIFYPSNFNLVNLEINYIKRLAPEFLEKEKLIEKVNNFNHIYIIATFKPLNNDKKITICNTHIVSNPKFDNIKILQSYLLSRRLEQYSRVVFCGDFNSVPDSKTYELLSTGKVKFPYYGELKIKNNFFSSYCKFHEGEINITTHTSNMTTPKFTETIDYIWLTKNFTVLNTCEVLTRNIIKNYNKSMIPNAYEPSDHYMLFISIK